MYLNQNVIFTGWEDIGPMKGVIPTPDIANIFHPTPDIKSTLDTMFFKSTHETVKYLTSTLDTDPPFKGPGYG